MLRSTAIASWLLLLNAAASADLLEDFVALRVGSFTSEAQDRHDDRYTTAIWHIVEIWPQRDDDARWLYTESWIDGATAPYLQRISKVTVSDAASVAERRFTIADADAYIGKWQAPATFDALEANALTEVEGCTTVMTRTGADRFEGGTLGAGCANGYKGAAYAVSQTVLTGDSMSNWDRGFAADGELVWGPAAGGYRFRRVGADTSCVDPVRMLVYGTISDRAGFMRYVGALAASGLYVEAQGYYEAMTPVIEVFEGDPPPNRAVIVVRFPCLARAQTFWNSDAYAEIRKLREGIADFEVTVLRVPPYPAYMEE